MHRATPRKTAFRSYVAGGARTTISEVDDKKQMQETGASFMKAETRDKIEAPQNYGFTSVVADADKDKDGKVTDSAEGFVSFMGGNRSFPVMHVMDDRRHRLKELDKGDSAMYGLKDWGEQFLVNKDGMYVTGNKEKKIRLQLVENKNKQQQQGQQQGSGNPGGASASGQQGQGQQQQDKGQKSLHKEESKTFIDITENAVTITRGKGTVIISDNQVIGYHGSKENSFMVNGSHTHIRFGSNRIFVDGSGCWSTKEIKVKSDQNDG